MKIDKAVKRETAYIAVIVVLLSIIMELVFFFIGKWNFSVLWGNILGSGVAVLNFFLMALTVQKNLGKESGRVKSSVTLSMLGRYAMMVVAAVLGGIFACFSIYAVVIPFVFPRIGIALRPVIAKLGIMEM